MTLRASVQLSVEPLEEGYPLGEIRLGPGVVEPAFARLVAGETVAQRGGAGVYLFHVPHGEGEAQRRRSVRQGRERVFPDEGRQQLDSARRFRIMETVAWDTPEAAATSLDVTFFLPIITAPFCPLTHAEG